ncbi:MAG: histidine phosphatase family protein [Chloroflexi bacterium]|nr:histidine phosphatase family protein [Chloroflexota bacterium]
MIHSNFQCEFYFIRHGESESNATPGFAAGVNFDAPLTPLGFDQAEMLGRRFKDEGMCFDRIYSSSMTRTLQTTETMLKAMGASGAPYETVDDIIEQQIPGWRGKPSEEVLTPEVRELRATAGMWFVPGDGESERSVERRFSIWLEDEILFNGEYAGSGRNTIAIVSHGQAMRCIFHYILGFQERYFRSIALDNASISRFKFTLTGWWLLSINDASHTNQIGDLNRVGETTTTA